MIGVSIGDILPFAIGIAVSPIPIIAVILMLFSARAEHNGPAFLGGWVVGLLAVTAIISVIVGAVGADSDEGTNDLVDWIKMLLGLGLLFLAFKQWQGRPAEGERATTPGWMASVESFSPAQALGLGLISAVNPKNLLLAAGAGAAIGQAPGVSAVESAVAIIVFTAIASVPTAGAVGYYMFGGDAARKALDGFKSWLTQNNATIMAVVLFVLGFVMIGQAISGLAD